LAIDTTPVEAPPPITGKPGGRTGDRVFLGVTRFAGIVILVIMGSIAAFLLVKSVPAIQKVGLWDFLTTQTWNTTAEPPVYGIATLVFGTFMSAAIALVIALPVGYGVALFIAYYAPRRIAAPMGYLIDLLAAVPSIIFGMWGVFVLMPNMVGVGMWLNNYLGWIPLFRNDLGQYTKSLLVAGVVLAIMIIPTIAAITREVFIQVPSTQIEAAQALGATRWETMRMSVFPFGKAGMISAAMLGLGRALGETIAVALVLSASFKINWHISEPAGNTIAANIALKWNEANALGLSALIASGLVLFVITLAVNMIARAIIVRGQAFSGANE
jgi:phosphate transport system permease protein